jgi:hypothetical protein
MAHAAQAGDTMFERVESTMGRPGLLAKLCRLALVGVAVAGMGASCAPVPDTVLTNPETGEVIPLSEIDPILSNTNLTSDEKEQQLLDLGIPADLVQTLMASSGV